MTRRLPTTDLALVAVFAAIIAGLGMTPGITVLGMAVPVTAQTLGVMLAGAILGPRRGALAVLTFLALVAVGVGVLSGGRTGLHWLVAAPSAGFLWGWIPGAAVTGALVRHRPRRWTSGWVALACATGGIGVVYAVGVPVMAWATDTGIAHAFALSAVFLPGDLLKVAVATVVTSAVIRGYPPLVDGPTRRRRTPEPGVPIAVSSSDARD